MTAYVILYPDPSFTGCKAGVDFYNGRGSTSSLDDVARLIELGCRAEDPAVQAQAEATNKREAERQAEQAVGRSVQDAIERMPGYKAGRRHHSHHGPHRTT